jgi:drug/metabolite transporter (DMT)-like permease
MKKHDRLDAFGAAAMTGLCGLWALSHVAVKIANSGISPAFQSGLRSLGALACLMIWARLRGVSLLAPEGTLAVGIAAGAMFAAEFALIFWALAFTDVARGIIILYTTPFFVALGAHYFVPGEQMHRMQFIGLLCAFAGVAIAFSDGLTLPDNRALIGDSMMLGAAALWGATTVLVKASKLSRIDPAKTLAYQLAVSGIVLTPFALLLGERGFFDPTPLVVGSLVFPDRRDRLRFLSRLVCAHSALSGLNALDLHFPYAAVLAGARSGIAGRARERRADCGARAGGNGNLAGESSARCRGRLTISAAGRRNRRRLPGRCG